MGREIAQQTVTLLSQTPGPHMGPEAEPVPQLLSHWNHLRQRTVVPGAETVECDTLFFIQRMRPTAGEMTPFMPRSGWGLSQLVVVSTPVGWLAAV